MSLIMCGTSFFLGCSCVQLDYQVDTSYSNLVFTHQADICKNECMGVKSLYGLTVCTMDPRLAHTQVILLHKHWHTFDILFPRRSQPVTTVGGGEDLAMRLLLCRCMQVGKGSAIGTIMHYTTPSCLPHNALYPPSQ